MMQHTTWCIDRVHYDDGWLEIEGWAIPPEDEYCPVTFSVNGTEFGEIDFPGYREDIADLFWYRHGAELSAFACRSPITREELFAHGPAAFQFCEKKSLRPLREEHTVYWLDPRLDTLPLPSRRRRRRVHGRSDPASFLAQGANTFVKLERAFEKICGRGFVDAQHILDWGCGSGRVTRYFQALSGVSIAGTDIDASNVDWCSENLSFATFSTCGHDPPTSFPAASFDLIIGISVMTHLAQVDRAAWLRELQRILASGGICMLTIHGAVSLSRTSFELESLTRWRRMGFLDGGISLAAKELTSEPERYIDCFLSEAYVRDTWSEHFEILEILPGYIDNMQDLVVMQKRAD
jgi:SAM-dependent methyltransferase